MRMILLLLATLPAHAKPVEDEAKCLAQIMWSEARGESVEGVVAIGQATINRANGKSICSVSGVTRKKPIPAMQDYYRALAKQILSTKNDIVKGADSWNTGKKPAYKGEVTRIIGGHVFYVMNGP